MSILEVDQLTKAFDKLIAVDAISFAIEQGEVFGLLGPNGAGKSTTIKMLTTLLEPTSGTARIGGYDLRKEQEAVRRTIGYVPQALSADGTLTGFENLLVFAKLYDLPRRTRVSQVRTALASVGLSEAGDRLVRTYSGGMIRRLEIAQAVLHQPLVLYLDEPTVGLDPVARAAVWDHLQRLRIESGMTVLLTTHYMDEAESLCNRIAIMHRGKIAVIGTPDELKASIGHEGATLNEVFAHYTGDSLESGGSYREASRTRRAAQRVG